MLGMCLQVKASPPTGVQLGRAKLPLCFDALDSSVAHCNNTKSRAKEYWRAHFSSVQVDQVESESADTTACGLGHGLLVVIDSHCYLDRNLGRLSLPANGTLRDILQAVPVPPSDHVSVTRLVTVYSDLKT